MLAVYKMNNTDHFLIKDFVQISWKRGCETNMV